MNQKIIDKLRRLKPELYEKFNVQEIALFGSFSRNNEKEYSDIDILVKLEKPLGLKFITLLNFLETHLKEKVDLVTDKAIRPQMKDSILKEAIYI